MSRRSRSRDRRRGSDRRRSRSRIRSRSRNRRDCGRIRSPGRSSSIRNGDDARKDTRSSVAPSATTAATSSEPVRAIGRAEKVSDPYQQKVEKVADPWDLEPASDPIIFPKNLGKKINLPLKTLNNVNKLFKKIDI